MADAKKLAELTKRQRASLLASVRSIEAKAKKLKLGLKDVKKQTVGRLLVHLRK